MLSHARKFAFGTTIVPSPSEAIFSAQREMLAKTDAIRKMREAAIGGRNSSDPSTTIQELFTVGYEMNHRLVEGQESAIHEAEQTVEANHVGAIDASLVVAEVTGKFEEVLAQRVP